MSFWAYMLHCRGGAFYVGHTDNLEQRLAQHQSGAIRGFTAERLPVELVWSQEFATRVEAKEAERRLKGWSRAKEMALIRGDWDCISLLAKSQTAPLTVYPEPVEGSSFLQSTDRPGRPFDKLRVDGLGNGVQFTLTPHPAAPPADPAFKVWATVDHAASLGPVATTNIWFGVSAPASRFVIPPLSEPWRADNLWRTTCFEVFLRPAGTDAYREWNFAPSGNWAAFAFSAYREDMDRADVGAPPYIRMEDNFTWWAVGATIAVDAATQWRLGLNAILEEVDGTKSYWSLAHPADKPDFHHPDCFAAKLP